jgi:hypothetical protein
MLHRPRLCSDFGVPDPPWVLSKRLSAFTHEVRPLSWNPPTHLPEGVSSIPELFHFPADMTPVEAEVNRLNDQVLVRYYERDWKDIAR